MPPEEYNKRKYDFSYFLKILKVQMVHSWMMKELQPRNEK